ncbi:MAG: hypothetical protein HYU64_09180 [Armatimonadetes bacterium]|nr:hypothetical protein [Armatimonadota bacterium]
MGFGIGSLLEFADPLKLFGKKKTEETRPKPVVPEKEPDLSGAVDATTSQAQITAQQVGDKFASALGRGPAVHKRDGFPEIIGGTDEQAAAVWAQMENIPPQDRESISRIRFVDPPRLNYTLLDVQDDGTKKGEVHIATDIFKDKDSAEFKDPNQARQVVLHETAHAVQARYLDGWGNKREEIEEFSEGYAAFYGGDKEKLQKDDLKLYSHLDGAKYRREVDKANILEKAGSLVGQATVVATPAVLGGLAAIPGGYVAARLLTSAVGHLGNLVFGESGGPWGSSWR